MQIDLFNSSQMAILSFPVDVLKLSMASLNNSKYSVPIYLLCCSIFLCCSRIYEQCKISEHSLLGQILCSLFYAVHEFMNTIDLINKISFITTPFFKKLSKNHQDFACQELPLSLALIQTPPLIADSQSITPLDD